MTILSTVCTKLLCTNAHLGRRVAAHHFKVYIRGSRNGIAILDSDKTLICLRNALHFIGSLIRQNGRSFFLKTNHFFIYLIMEKMIYSIMEKMGSCINDSQWKIGAFLTNSYANPKKFRSRITAMNATLPLFWNRASGMRTYSSSSSSPGPRSRGQRLPFYLFCLIGIALLSAGPCWLLWYLNLDLFFEMLFESLSSLGSYLYIFSLY
ncbi:ribosomal protein S2, mitochondrial-like [Panicum virgatum]|uniref:ribosomal protein S2, mitochondrial-like n=1 Tax=Panicum virgatum TaxID=38727 RepID=UPI0019D6A51C|nr:ribosomal protein S2, mitochondrial-like [Panicum virgatum]